MPDTRRFAIALRRRATRGLAIAFVAVTLAACAGDSDEAPVSPPPETATAALRVASPAPERASPAVTATASPLPPGVAGDFPTLFAKYRAAETRIDYTMSITGQLVSTGGMTMRQAAGLTRLDFSSPQGGSLTFIEVPGKRYLCIAQQRICLDATAAGSIVSPSPLMAVVQDLNANGGKYAHTLIASRRIAGVNASCFELTIPQTEKNVTCVGPDGQMLYTESTNGGTTAIMTAVAIGSKPPPSDFEPLYPVVALPAATAPAR